LRSLKQKKDVDVMHSLLEDANIRVASVHGDRTQEQRNLAIKSFSTGRVNVLLATNVAARGLDIKNVGHVINYELPKDMDDYIHRIGRTGRSGKQGIATSFVSEDTNSYSLKKLREILIDGKQEIPEWLEKATQSSQNSRQSSGRSKYQPQPFSRFSGRGSSRDYPSQSNRDRSFQSRDRFQSNRDRLSEGRGARSFESRGARSGSRSRDSDFLDDDDYEERPRFPSRDTRSTGDGLAGILEALNNRKNS